jgi:DNA-binding CsgD family transcriptional regulator
LNGGVSSLPGERELLLTSLPSDPSEPGRIHSFDHRSGVVLHSHLSSKPVTVRQVLCETLIGRDGERDLIREALWRARSRAGGLVFVTGEAGIGKSRLAREAAGVAGELGLKVMQGRAVAGGSHIPFRPFVEALLSELRDSGPPDLPELQPYRHALARLSPEWGHAAGEVSPLLVHEAVLRLLSALAGDRGLVLTLEDLHWADLDTLSLLEYLADHVHDCRLLVLATARSDEPGPALMLADTLAGRRVALHLLLGRLSSSEVAEMVRSCLDDEQELPLEALAAVRRRSQGVPFLVEETLAAYLDAEAPSGELPIPPSYRDIVRGRMAQLEEQVRRVVEAAAALPSQFDWAYLAEASGLASDDVLGAVRQAAEAKILVIERRTDHVAFAFRHALVPEAILEELLPPERQRLLLRSAEALLRLYPGLTGEWCERAADLFARAGERSRASELLVESGRRALRRSALATAEHSLEKARSLVEGDRWKVTGVDRVLVDALALQGKIDRLTEIGVSALEFMSALPGTLGTPERLGDLHLRIARGLAESTETRAAAVHLEHARTLAKAANDEALAARANALGAQLEVKRGNDRAAHRLGRRARSSAERLRLPDALIGALRVEARLALLDGEVVDAASILTEALRAADRADLTLWRVRVLLDLAEIDELTHADTETVERARELAQRTEAVVVQAEVELALARLRLARHELSDAAAALSRSREICARFQLPLVSDTAAFEAEAAALAGDRRQLREVAAQVPQGTPARTTLVAARALLRLVTEERQEGRRALEAAISETGASRIPGLRWYLGLQHLLSVVDGDSAIATDRRAAPPTVESALNAFGQAVTAGRAGLVDEAVAAFLTADYALVPFPWRRHYARRLVAEAALRDGWGGPEEWLGSSLSFFEAHGLAASASACRGILRRAGVRVPRKGRGAARVPPSLQTLGVTSREVDVLELVVEGMSNREIAERLYLSLRTVESHVASLMRKTGIHTRTALAGHAREPLEQ